MDASGIKFGADRMLGRLARMLRLLGYDTTYAVSVTTEELRRLALEEGRTILTRGEISRRFPSVERILSLKSEIPGEQLREVVTHFSLDTRSGLWTRCTVCDGPIQKVDKPEVESLVPPKVFAVYAEFFRCTDCRHVYWRGSHVERILKNLDSLLGARDG